MSLPLFTPQAWVAAGIGCAAVIEDLKARRISNWIPLTALAGGLGIRVFESGWHGALSSVLGCLAGAVVFLIFYLLGGMGGGDVKLMAGFGAVLGPGQVLQAALLAALCGGLFAAAAIVFCAVRRLCSRGQSRADEIPGSSRPVATIPYAPAIALGAWLSFAAKAGELHV